ncbi:hypothetical protein KCU93_g449, partial [Aureobasidium melanogenum]
MVALSTQRSRAAVAWDRVLSTEDATRQALQGAYLRLGRGGDGSDLLLLDSLDGLLHLSRVFLQIQDGLAHLLLTGKGMLKVTLGLLPRELRRRTARHWCWRWQGQWRGLRRGQGFLVRRGRLALKENGQHDFESVGAIRLTLLEFLHESLVGSGVGCAHVAQCLDVSSLFAAHCLWSSISRSLSKDLRRCLLLEGRWTHSCGHPTTAYINGATGAALEIHNMKARFEQMNKTVNQLKEANKDNRAGLAHRTQQAEQVGKALDQISDGLQQTMASCQSAANALQQRRQNPMVPTPEQIQTSAQRGGQ